MICASHVGLIVEAVAMAGREAPGKAFRLYTESSAALLPQSTPPEILRTNLATVVLQMKVCPCFGTFNTTLHASQKLGRCFVPACQGIDCLR